MRDVATAVVVHDKHILLSGIFLSRPVDEVGQRVGTGDVSIVGTIEILFAKNFLIGFLGRVNNPS